MNKFNKYCIIIPAYQSEETLPRLIATIRSLYPEIKIIVVDDGSTDGSSVILKEIPYIKIVSHPVNIGKGAAIKSGIRAAKEMGFEFGIFMDSDLQHDPKNIGNFIKIQNQYKVAMIIGRRHFSRKIMPFHRILSNTVTSFIISIRTNKRIHDSQCGYRLIDLNAIPPNHISYDGFQFESEFLIRYLDAGNSFIEIEIPTIYNQTSSSISNVKDTLQFIRLILRSYLWI